MIVRDALEDETPCALRLVERVGFIGDCADCLLQIQLISTFNVLMPFR
jgi:hypothetical protein